MPGLLLPFGGVSEGIPLDKDGEIMKILLLGSLISFEQMELLNHGSREKASVAPVNYETMLAKGLAEHGADVEVLSVPAVAAYPHSIYKCIPSKREIIENQVPVQWAPYINIQGLKQLSIKRSITNLLKQWLQVNQAVRDKAVLMYSIYPPYADPAIRLCRQYHCHISAVITDLPEYMYSWKGASGIRGAYAKRLSRQMVSLQGQCGSYILFTRPMAARMNIVDKPFLVSEGFCDASIYDGIPAQEKYERKTVVYGGNLSRLYGIQNLVRGFMQTDLDAELHLYGSGEDTAFVEACTGQDPRVKYFGRVDRKTLLAALRRAHLLVINKPTGDDYSNYSFSSKILEYMASGTPLLTTKVGGMPEEYEGYLDLIEDESPEGIARSLTAELHRSEETLNLQGTRARQFAVSKKGYLQMTAEIYAFLLKQLPEEKQYESTSN